MNERLRTDFGYNLHLLSLVELEESKFQMPIIKAMNEYPEELIGFNYAKTSKSFSKGIHFYLDDYQFERVWNQPERYAEMLRKFYFVCTPDFSLYTDMPRPMQIYNTYRNRLLGAWWQEKGINVIPTISWSDEESFEFCFNGVEPGGVVTVSTVGVVKYPLAKEMWLLGMEEMLKRLKPSTILIYGKTIEFDSHGATLVYFDNSNVERMNDHGR